MRNVLAVEDWAEIRRLRFTERRLTPAADTGHKSLTSRAPRCLAVWSPVRRTLPLVTLIVGFVNAHYGIFASDRRVTTRRRSRVERMDLANKAFMLDGRLLFGYTGPANMPSKNTDLWVADLLGHLGTKDYIAALRDRTQAALDGFGPEWRPEDKRMAFIGVGYPKWIFKSGVDKPTSFRIANFSYTARGVVDRPHMEVEKQVLAVPRQFRCLVDGSTSTIRQDDVDSMTRDMQDALNSDPNSWKGVAGRMIDLIREVASRDDGVGPGVSISILPSIAVPAPMLATWTPGEPPPDVLTGQFNAFIPPTTSGTSYVRAYPPTSVMNGAVVARGLESATGHLPPARDGGKLIETAKVHDGANTYELRIFELPRDKGIPNDY